DAIALLETEDDWKHLCLCYNFLGLIYAALGNAEMIRHYFEKHLDAARKWGNTREQIGGLQNLVVWYSNENRPDEALEYYRQAEALDPRHEFIKVTLVLSSIYRQKGEYNKALRLCRQELKALQHSDQKREIISVLLMMGSLYEKSGQTGRAIE